MLKGSREVFDDVGSNSLLFCVKNTEVSYVYDIYARHLGILSL